MKYNLLFINFKDAVWMDYAKRHYKKFSMESECGGVTVPRLITVKYDYTEFELERHENLKRLILFQFRGKGMPGFEYLGGTACLN